MKTLRKHLFILLSALLVLVAGSLFADSQPVQAANNYNNLTLVGDLGLPQAVVSVMINNSLDANGSTPNVSATDLTVGAVDQWQTVSLADRTQNSDVSFVSSVDATVANWVGGLATNTNDNVETSDMLLSQGVSDGSFDMVSLLSGSTLPVADSRSQPYTLANLPVLNKLMLVLMSAKNAKTIDLTGLTSKVTAPVNRVKILSLFQTITMPNLTELDLGSNLFGPGLTESGWAYWVFRTRTLGSKSVITWDLSYENLTTLDSSLLSSIGSQTRNVNLASNVLTTIGYNNQGVLAIGGKIDLSNNDNLDSDNSDTFIVLATIISTGGNTVLPDVVVNAIVIKAVDNWMTVSNLGINAVASQLTSETLAALVNSKNPNAYLSALDPDKLLASTVQGLDDATYQNLLNYFKKDEAQAAKLTQKRNNDSGSTATKASVSATGAWAFGNYTLGQTAPLTAQDKVRLTGTLPAGQRLSVTMSDWTSGDSTFAPQMTLPAGSNGWNAVDLQAGTAAVVLTNPNTTAMQYDQTLMYPRLTISPSQANKMKVGATYTGTMTWTIEDVPTTDHMFR
ncbi:hypothetical protein [Lacticaseibacillus porcinae]|uniref:hypothetical protein n=1 Tax=Lacticaseibacillus porcinae TaxID=1123687 RepID=UPI000F767C53|nr:hypothetical protein [Lacticaseibacillus porcinae]